VPGLRPFRRSWLILLLLVILMWVSHPVWMAAAGSYLVHADSPFQADIAVVLGGDSYGHRILKGGELVRQGYTRRVLVSGPGGVYGLHESDLAIPFAVRHGYPETWFVPLQHNATSTRAEAAFVAAELARLGVRRCLLVTSDYHTRRAGRYFRAAVPNVEFRVIAAPDEFFRPRAWWKSRDGQKIFVMEWAKTVTSWFGV
jgi:uncharacterized SAM-binding protein YcdF (DUF218 family)